MIQFIVLFCYSLLVSSRKKSGTLGVFEILQNHVGVFEIFEKFVGVFEIIPNLVGIFEFFWKLSDTFDFLEVGSHFWFFIL